MTVVVVVVVVVMLVVVLVSESTMCVALCVAMGDRTMMRSRPEQIRTEGEDHGSAHQSEPADDALACDRCAQGERQPEQQHPAGVGAGHRGADEHGVSGRALPACDVGGHHGLAMAGQHGVRCSEHHGQQHGQQPHTEGEVVAADHAVELAAETLDSIGERPASDEGSTTAAFLLACDRSPRRTRDHRELGAADVER